MLKLKPPERQDYIIENSIADQLNRKHLKGHILRCLYNKRAHIHCDWLDESSALPVTFFKNFFL